MIIGKRDDSRCELQQRQRHHRQKHSRQQRRFFGTTWRRGSLTKPLEPPKISMSGKGFDCANQGPYAMSVGTILLIILIIILLGGFSGIGGGPFYGTGYYGGGGLGLVIIIILILILLGRI
jgi:hypothetical protein